MKTMKKSLSILLAVLMLAGCLSAAFSVSAANETITSLAITSDFWPSIGGNFPKPSDYTVVANGTVPMTVKSIRVFEVTFSGSTPNYTNATEPFKSGKTYQFGLVVSPNTAGYVFENRSVTCTLNEELQGGYQYIRENESYAAIRFVLDDSHDWPGNIDSSTNLVIDGGTVEYRGCYGINRRSHVFVPVAKRNFKFVCWNTGTESIEQPFYSCKNNEASLAALQNVTAVFQPCQSGVSGALSWNYDPGTKTLTISGTGAMIDYDPEVSSSEDDTFAPWWSYYSDTKKIVIENGVTSIGDFAFYYFKALESVSIPETVTGIGAIAFWGASELRTVTLPRGLRSIGVAAFAESGLTRVTIPGGVRTIEEGAFDSCASLEEVVIEDGVKKIGESAFGGCKWLKTVTIPASVREISDYAFFGCPTLNTINYGGSEDDWKGIIFGEGVFTDSDGNALTPTVKYNYNPPKPVNVCPWCGGVHEGFFQGIIGFFHGIFARIFGARY